MSSKWFLLLLFDLIGGFAQKRNKNKTGIVDTHA